MWTLPGGGMDPGETHRQTLVREFVEETALVPEIGRFLQSFSHVRPANVRRGPLHVIQFVYEVAAKGTPTVIEVGGSTAEAAWVPLREARALPLVEIAAWAVAGPDSVQSER
jgi:8-oxo-dGTP diphosphatase